MVNKPIIETEAEEVPDLDAKLLETEKKIGQLYSETNSASSNVSAIVLKWNSLPENKILDAVEGMNKKFGGENQCLATSTI